MPSHFKSRIKLALLALLFSVAAASCSMPYYLPQVGHMPLVSEKGELVAEVGMVPAMVSLGLAWESLETATIPSYFPYQVACAYAFTDHWAVQIALRNSIRTRNQAMVGWYTPLGDNATVEVYGGYAYADCSSGYGNEFPYTQRWGDAQTLFLQGDIGIPAYQISWLPGTTTFSAGFGLRVGGVWMNYQQEQHDMVYDPDNDSYSEVTTHPSVIHESMLEVMPMLQLGIGGKYFATELGIGRSLTPQKAQQFAFPLAFNLSLTYRLPLLKLLE